MGKNALMNRSMNNRRADMDKYSAFKKYGASPLHSKDSWQRHIYSGSGYIISEGPLSVQLIRANTLSLKRPQQVLQAILIMAEAIVTARH